MEIFTITYTFWAKERKRNEGRDGWQQILCMLENSREWDYRHIKLMNNILLARER